MIGATPGRPRSVLDDRLLELHRKVAELARAGARPTADAVTPVRRACRKLKALTQIAPPARLERTALELRRLDDALLAVMTLEAQATWLQAPRPPTFSSGRLPPPRVGLLEVQRGLRGAIARWRRHEGLVASECFKAQQLFTFARRRAARDRVERRVRAKLRESAGRFVPSAVLRLLTAVRDAADLAGAVPRRGKTGRELLLAYAAFEESLEALRALDGARRFASARRAQALVARREALVRKAAARAARIEGLLG